MFKLLKTTSIRFSLFLFAGLLACGPVRFSTESSEQGSGPDATSIPPEIMTRNVNYNSLVSPPNNKLDLLLVIDNSNSMLQDNQKLAARLSSFVNDLASSSIDWQMCVTVTSTLNVNGNQVWGASVLWANYVPPGGTNAWVLKSGTGNLNNIFVDTIASIGAGWDGTDDERGLKAAWWHLYHGDIRYANNSGCYRSGAALSMIVISDEDERSVGGRLADQYYEGEYKALENDDLPSTLVSQVQDVFGTNKRFTVNSIIVKPDDNACYTSQDAAGSKSHYGRIYADASALTGGGVGSICEADYGPSLKYFKDVIQTSMASFPLECTPHNDQISFTINGSASSSYSLAVQGMSAVFTPPIPAGVLLGMMYQCLVD